MNTACFQDLTIAVWVYDIDQYHIVWANNAALSLWEADSLEQLQGKDFKPHTSDALQESLLEYRRAFEQQHIVLSHNWRFAPAGVEKHAYCHLSGFQLDDGRTGMLVEALPITELNQHLKIGSSAILSTYFADGRFFSASSTFSQKINHKANNLSDIVTHLSDLDKIYVELDARSRFDGDVLMNSRQGPRWYHVIAVMTAGIDESKKIVLHQYDIHERKIGEIALLNDLYTDSLTGLLNRRGFYRKLDDIQRKNKELLLFYIDLDGFKLINDSFGHSMGDEVLQMVATRLDMTLPSNVESFSCRFGGDEFIVGVALTPNSMDDFFDEGLFAESMVSVLSDVYHDEESCPMLLSASIGLAHYPRDVSTITEAVFCADAAMYQAKALGKRRWKKYQKGMERKIRRKSLIAQRLFQAEKNGELMLYYQPIWDFSNGNQRICSFEALLRWYDEELGWVNAEHVVQAAEEIGIIDDIERWAIAKALSDLRILRQYVNPDVTVAVNLSAVHLRAPELPRFLCGMIEENQLKPSDLTLELTESALIADIQNKNHVVRHLAGYGFRISIDDFGTGYSSLAYLHHIPAHTVKIDQSFVQHIEGSSKTVQQIQKLIDAYGMYPLVEGVETKKQQEALISLGIYLHQGFYKGKPMPLIYYCQENKALLERR